MATPIYVEGTSDQCQQLAGTNGNLNIADPANKLVYSAHSTSTMAAACTAHLRSERPGWISPAAVACRGMARIGRGQCPEGVQTAFLKGKPNGSGVSASIVQSLTFPAGEYALSFQAHELGTHPFPFR